MVSASFTCAAVETDRLIGELYELGTLGITEEDLPGGAVRLVAYFEAVPAELLSRFPEFIPKISKEEPRDWVAESRAFWEPLAIGKRIYLAPPWCGEPAPPGRIRLEMPTGMASGTGLHPATQLALEGLERTLEPGGVVLDLGTGSGILATAACLLGAERVLACDLEVDAVRAAKANTERCGAAVSLYAGSTRSLRDRSVDLIVANLNHATIRGLLPEIRRLLRTPGRAVLAGFRQDEAAGLRPALERSLLRTSEQLDKAGWACLICEAEK